MARSDVHKTGNPQSNLYGDSADMMRKGHQLLMMRNILEMDNLSNRLMINFKPFHIITNYGKDTSGSVGFGPTTF
jgi:hypothetical protein